MEIRLKSASKHYSKTKALDNLSLTAQSGELIAILGLNGAGKSTLLKALSGVVGLKSGELLYNGKKFSYADLEMRRKALFIPDTPPLILDETVLKNISIFLTQYKKTDEEAMGDKVIKLLEQFELVEKADTPVWELSRGEEYKVGLIILAAINPEVWILDEPFSSGMDASGIRLFRELSQDAVNHGSTVIYTTQLIDMAEDYATRVCVINRGQAYADVTQDELRDLAKEDPLISKLKGKG